MAGWRSMLFGMLCFASGALLLAQEPPKHPAATNPHLGNKDSVRSGMAAYRALETA